MARYDSELDFSQPSTLVADDPAPQTAAPARQAAFADYPGPVIRISASGDVSAGNELATPFLAASSGGQIDEMARAASRLRRHEPIPECLLTAVDALSQTVVYGFTLVPLPSSGGVIAFGREMSDEIAQRERLISITRSLRTLLDFSCHFAFETDADGLLSFIAPRQVMGYQAAKLVGRKPAEIFSQSPLTDVARIFAAREAVRGVLLKAIAGDGKLVEMTARAKPILGPTGDRIGARGVLNFASAEDERRFAAEQEPDFDVALDDLRRLFAEDGTPQQSIQQSCARTAEILNTAGTAAYVLHPRSAEFRRVAWHGPAVEHSIDLCARPFLERLTDGRASVDGRKYRRQIFAAASRSDRDLVGAFVCWREEAEDPWSDAEQNFAEKVALMQAASLGEVRRTTASISTWTGASASELAALVGAVTPALAARPRIGAEPSLLCVAIDNIENLAVVAGRRRVEDLLVMFGLILRRAAGDGMVVQVAQDEFAVWLPTGGKQRAKTVADACLTMVDPLRGGAQARTKIGLSIGIAIATPDRFASFEAIQKEALQGAKTSQERGGHRYAFI